MDRPSLREGYTTREVAALLALSPTQVRSCVRAGFVQPEAGPRGEMLFSFQDLVLLRTAKALIEARIPRRRIRIALQKLHSQLPQGQPLTAVRISAHGHHVVARDGAEAWHPESGQTLLDFEVADLARAAGALEPHAWSRSRPQLVAVPPADAAPAASLTDRAAGAAGAADAAGAAGAAGSEHRAPNPGRGAPPPPLRPVIAGGAPGAAAESADGSVGAGAADWYERGIELEQEEPAAAVAAYRRAIALAPGLADAHLNLGRLLHEAGDPAGAEDHYRMALTLGPGDALAAFNLGVALQDQLRLREAAAAYQQALAQDPALADAHFNLSGVYEQLGDQPAAFRHLRTYRTLIGGGS
jgi:tetratricopeptide (TPR) repeat protein